MGLLFFCYRVSTFGDILTPVKKKPKKQEETGKKNEQTQTKQQNQKTQEFR